MAMSIRILGACMNIIKVMRKYLMLLLVFVLVSCTKEAINPVPDTVIEDLKGKVSLFEIQEYNLESDTYSLTTYHYDSLGYITTSTFSIGERERVVLNDLDPNSDIAKSVEDWDETELYRLTYTIDKKFQYEKYDATKRIYKDDNKNRLERRWISSTEFSEVTRDSTYAIVGSKKRILDKDNSLKELEVIKGAERENYTYTLDKEGYTVAVICTNMNNGNKVTYKIVNEELDSKGNVLKSTYSDEHGKVVKELTYYYEYYN